MPTPHHKKNLGVYGNRYRLAEAAQANLMLAVTCKACHRPPVLFLASDLVKIFDPNRDCFYPPPFPCSLCGSDRAIEIKLRPQQEAAVGRLVVRRLVGMKQVPVWRNALLGD